MNKLDGTQLIDTDVVRFTGQRSSAGKSIPRHNARQEEGSDTHRLCYPGLSPCLKDGSAAYIAPNLG
jgi:hypothetical protein